MFVYVFCETNVMLGQISKVLNSIQNAGLRCVLLACSGQQGGTNGTYLLTLDCAKYPFSGGDSGGERWTSGFYPSGAATPLWVEDWLARRSIDRVQLREHPNIATNMFRGIGSPIKE